MQKYFGVAQKLNGDVAPGVSVLVQTYPAGTTATIYSVNGGSAVANPMTTDSYGEYSFFAANGRYQVVLSGASITTRTIQDILLDDPAEATVGVFTSLTASGNATVSGNLTANGNTVLGDATTDTLNVGAGGIVKDSLGNIGLGVTPETSNASYRSVRLASPGAGLYASNSTATLWSSNNAYLDQFGIFRAVSAGYSSVQLMEPNLGRIIWQNPGSSKTAGQALNLVDRMWLNLNGSLFLTAGVFPDTSASCDLGSTGLTFKDAYVQTVHFPATQVPSSDVNTLDDYREGSYTGTLTGCTTSPTATIKYTKVGRLVNLWLETSLFATSNTTTCTLTGAPAEIRPSGFNRSGTLVRAVDNGNNAAGYVDIGTDGTITLNASVSGGAFTASGTKGFQPFHVTYSV